MDTTPPPDLALLASLKKFGLTARFIARSAVAGTHRACGRGSSIAFSEHKIYVPGDDLRRLDWQAYAKTDRFHIRQYEEQSSLDVLLWLDCSGSMGFGHGACLPKLRYAALLATSLAHLALQGGDAAGCATLHAEQITAHLPARRGLRQAQAVAMPLYLAQAKGPTHLAKALQQLASRHHRRSKIVVFSDLLDTQTPWAKALGELVACGHDVTVMHVLDPMELSFDYELAATFVSMEDTKQLFVHPRSLQNSYRTQMQHFINTAHNSLRAAGITVHPALTSAEPAQVLKNYLHRGRRERLMK